MELVAAQEHATSNPKPRSGTQRDQRQESLTLIGLKAVNIPFEKGLTQIMGGKSVVLSCGCCPFGLQLQVLTQCLVHFPFLGTCVTLGITQDQIHQVVANMKVPLPELGVCEQWEH